MNTVTVKNKTKHTHAEFNELLENASYLLNKLNNFRLKYHIKEDTIFNTDNNFAFLDGALTELIESELL